ncbi:MAG TPA: homoserine O-acetyltransferase [Thermoanaerobaculia bacterium]|nr:homoserine O-acetyltransferase [Thermoanaerobaculia bacterium]
MSRFGDPLKTFFWDLPEAFTLESGEVLPEVRVAYRTWGALDATGTNAVLVCHALTGSADADLWWGDLFGPGRTLDPERDFIVCSNTLGSCYGTTGPASPRPENGQPYGPDFPAVSVRDMVHLQAALLTSLGVRRLRLVLGGSLGGMQALEWAALYPAVVEAIAPIAVSGRHSAWCIGLSEAQRQAIFADPDSGLATARAIAMCTYRSRDSFEERFGRRLRGPGLFEVESYLRYQGEKLVDRFDANAYVTLTRAMDSHDLARGRGSYEEALRAIRQPALVVAVDSDVLYPPEEQRELAALLPAARLAFLHSPHGHDAFLLEAAELDRLLVDFRASRIAPARVARRRPAVQVVLAGATGRVGGALCEQLSVQVPALSEELGADLSVVGVVNSRRQAWDEGGIHPLAARQALATGEPNDWGRLERRMRRAAQEPGTRVVFVDCTASTFLAEQYAPLLASGVAVVTPNKLANVGPLARYRLLRDLSAGGGVPYRYETTVGAALPVLGTLSDLRRAGDRLLALSAVLSGTLSFVLHRVGQGTAFSAAVTEAHRLGLTEPNPREDLNGEDVARKLLILLREAGYDLEREDVAVEPLLPGGLPDEPDPERFLAALTTYDEAWKKRVEAARARGERLLHVASFDGGGPRIGLTALPEDHPAARIGAGENVVVYRTDRYSALPLTIAGPGAGPDITAAGVLIDLAAAARELVRRPAQAVSVPAGSGLSAAEKLIAAAPM